MVILASYGYKQSQVYNINCKVAPLLELIRRNSHSDICKLLQTRQEQLVKEITEISVKVEAKEKKLSRLENPAAPPEETKEVPQENLTKKRSAVDLKRVPKSSHALAESKKAEEARKAEEEKKKIEEAKKVEEEKKKAEEVQKKKKEEVKKGKKEEVKELSPEELKLQQIENHKNDLRRAIADFQTRKAKLQEKCDMIKASLEKFAIPPKEIDLVDQNSTRKFLIGREEEIAMKLLNTRSIYNVVTIENENFTPYEINGFCIRTIEEDSSYVEEPDPKAKSKNKTAKKNK